MSDPINPYAPPVSDLFGAVDTGIDPEQLAQARAALAAHLADPDLAARDRRDRRRGHSIVATFVIALLSVGMITTLAISCGLPQAFVVVQPISSLLTLGILLLLANQRIVSNPRNPAGALRLWFGGLSSNLPGRVRATLVPTARATALMPAFPHLLQSDPTESAVARFALWYAHRLVPGLSPYGMNWPYLRLIGADGDLATFEIRYRAGLTPPHLTCITFAAGSLLAIFLPLSLLLGVARFPRWHTAIKHLLRGPDGLWYVLDGTLDLGGVPS
jgi:hypothetical protein